jgi:pheromone shutdown protein TraB
LYVYAVLQIGTKVPYFGLIILIAVIIMICIINAKRQHKKVLYKKSVMFFASLIAIYLITGITPVGTNLTKIYGNIFLVTTDTFTKENSTQIEIAEFENFDEFKTVSVSERNDYLTANREKFINSNVVGKLIGIGYVENVDGKLQELKLSEMDFYDILFCNGILGTFLFAIPLLYFVILLILKKEMVTAELVYSLAMTVVVALLAGHVIVSPAVSIYIAIILVNNRATYRMLGTGEQIYKK